ncbi:death-associated protein 1 isoform X3 [Mauremys mutica]|uniref:death-associated protein 1 isoform X4 n=1 Tax=Mauremys reevesii TaxID=260615 RepID=UPI00193FF97C|nr:death-associated protein 1 isoform X4 [Mauremys reevesii]XP_044861558.1 death-associated protein 1 isoform X3 [Mauremys mutica]
MVCTTTGQSVDSSKLILQMHQKDVLPSVKAGGMRIVQKHPHTPDAKEEKDKDDQEWESSSPPKPTVFISGVIARGDKDFPPAAAQVAHQKPHPSVEKLPHPQHVNQHINQPRK